MSSPAFEREALRRAASKSKSYVDLTSGDDEVMPLQISRTRASSGSGYVLPPLTAVTIRPETHHLSCSGRLYTFLD